MSVLDSIKEKAKADVKHILLPEGSEERTVQAARIITDEKIAKVTLLGDEEEIKKVAEKFNVCLCGIDIINLGWIYGQNRCFVFFHFTFFS